MANQSNTLRHLPSLLLAISLTSFASSASSQTLPQPPANTPVSPTESHQTNSGQASSTTQPNDLTWVVRDPATGRLYQQRYVNVSVPVTRMEARTIEQPVYELQTEAKVQAVPQTIYKPTTQYVMQPKLRGWWNPVRQPVHTYEYVPVTSWQPQTEMVNQPTVTQRWVAKSQKIVVYQPVQSTEVRQQLVQTELPQPTGGALPTAALPAAQFAAQPVLPPLPVATSSRQPLVSVPLLAQQRILPWPQLGSGGLAKSGLRPIGNPLGIASSQANYAAPLRTASAPSDFSHRDALQAGMQPTVLR